MAVPGFHALTACRITREAEDAVAISFEVPLALRSLFRFRAGQYLTVRRPGDTSDARRNYSLCSAPEDGELRIGVREIAGGAVSPWLNREIRLGSVVECMPPEGHFGVAVDAGHARHLLLVAIGSGITPLLSIARHALRASPAHRVTLLYGNRTLASTMFREDLEDLKNEFLDRFALYCTFSREPQEIPLFDGRLDGARLREFLDRLVPAETIDGAWLCGPHAIVEEATAVLEAAGVPAGNIHIERFGAPPESAAMRPRTPDTALATAARVTLILDGVQREIVISGPEQPILDAARAAGLDLPFSCRTGVCATCRARLLEGKVHMTRNFALLKSDLEAGIVLTCQAHPLTPRVVISFDAR